ncbi:Glycine betaine/proline/choline/ectoine transporter VP1456 [Seminavis robusta]|uniref:Glycine betaine/proline/choline/ectoine transporter VP1456 n=1 Tax=Seminavis robusta TaxID=568900 RepID=A0A9N8DWH0_9STRA|nr:Glycine betaine/proline/choline/ectoine transporter VP1456 [Seminavis robusta]|eukprot:Sro333_g119460.1 Glycine betaine/proline/choline/ectoine transporter VP1456 (1039) ;mRNA; r:11072-14709
MTNETIRMDDLEEDDYDGDGLAPLKNGLKNSLTRGSSKRGLGSSEILKEEFVYDYDIKTYAQEKPMREWSFRLPFLASPIVMNPVTSMVGIIPLWAMTIWCMVEPENALEVLLKMRGKIALYFTWFVVITKPISFLFMMWITYKYGHIKFGGQHAKPEFGNFEYFVMIFCCGVGVGLFYYGVSEPLWHQSSHWFANAGYRSQDELDQMALLLTVYHWGFHGYTSYLVVAVASSLASYRFRLPLIFRSTFYPILGEYTWGYMGDLLDGMSIVVTIAGVCTSLGLGSIQLAEGAKRIGLLDAGLTEDETTTAQILIIWLLTVLTTASILMGLSIGLKYLSLLAFGLGSFLTLMVFMMEQSAYLLNLFVQTVGQYLQYSIFQIPFHTDAFGQLRPGEGRATDGKAAATWWYDAWTIFYWNWWVAWAVFVGLFIARVSYGRTLREVTFYSMVMPVTYCLTWFTIWGGAGLRQARQANELEQLGGTHFNDTMYYQSPDNIACYDVPQEEVIVDGEVVFTNYVKGVTPVCKFESTDAATFNVLFSFSFPEDWNSGFGSFLSILLVLALGTYFASSSDSGSLVVDFLSANGRHDTHWIQRLFWSLTEASVATALLYTGGSNALSALQAASIICGLPYTVIMTYLLQSIYVMCEQALDEDKIHFSLPRRQWIMPSYGGVFNVFEFLASFGKVHTARVVLGLDLPSTFQTTEFFTSLFLPFLPLLDIVFTMHPKQTSKFSNTLFVASYTALFFFWVAAFIVAGAVHSSMVYWGWAAFLINAFLLASVKHKVRCRRRLHGNMFGDLTSCFLLYPQVLTQIRIELLEYGADQVEKAPQKRKSGKKSAARKQPLANSSVRNRRHRRRLGEHSTRSDAPQSDDEFEDEITNINQRSEHSTSSRRRRNNSRNRLSLDDSDRDLQDTPVSTKPIYRGAESSPEEDSADGLSFNSSHSSLLGRRTTPVSSDPAPRPTTPVSSMHQTPVTYASRPTTPVSSMPTTPISSRSTTSRMTADDVRNRLRSHQQQRQNSRALPQSLPAEPPLASNDVEV